MRFLNIAVLVALTCSQLSAAEGIDEKTQAKLDAVAKDVATWAADGSIVGAVKEANTSPSEQAKAMTQDKWKALPVTDPMLRAMAKNPAAQFLRSKKGDLVSEAFLSAADGTKVALLNKTSSWSHKGKAKHDAPMTGKNWQGPVEVDESSGVRQIQIAVPVKDGDKAIGSLVVGVNLAKLSD